MQVKKNTVCYLSQMGHNNFIYPRKDSKALVRDDCEAERLNLITGGEPLTPVKIKISNLRVNKSTGIADSQDAHAVVWLEK